MYRSARTCRDYHFASDDRLNNSCGERVVVVVVARECVGSAADAASPTFSVALYQQVQAMVYVYGVPLLQRRLCHGFNESFYARFIVGSGLIYRIFRIFYFHFRILLLQPLLRMIRSMFIYGRIIVGLTK